MAVSTAAQGQTHHASGTVKKLDAAHAHLRLRAGEKSRLAGDGHLWVAAMKVALK